MQKTQKQAFTQPVSDSLRDASAPPRDLIPVPVLIGIFVAIEVAICTLMAPTFVMEWNAYSARRYERKHMYQESLGPLLKKVAEDPKSPTWLGETGNSYLNLRDYDKALDYYLKAQENRDNVPAGDEGGAKSLVTDFSGTIGYIYFKKGDLTNARKYLEAALKTAKLDPLANFTLGEIEFNKGDYRKATDYFKVVADNPVYGPKVKEYYAKIETNLFGQIK